MIVTRYFMRRVLKRSPNPKLEITASLCLLALVLGGAACAYQSRSIVAEIILKPGKAFAGVMQPPVPDYTRPDAWAVLPWSMGGGELAEGATAIDPETAPADVFECILTGTPFCTAPDQIGCLVVWNVFGEGGDERHYREKIGHRYGETIELIGDKPSVCVNPVTWRAGGAPSPWVGHRGRIAFDGVRGDGTIKLEGKVQAQCENGILRVQVSEEWSEKVMALSFPGTDWHSYDWGLFHPNIRANVETRIKAWETGAAG